jgi:hypothetical protein
LRRRCSRLLFAPLIESHCILSSALIEGFEGFCESDNFDCLILILRMLQNRSPQRPFTTVAVRGAELIGGHDVNSPALVVRVLCRGYIAVGNIVSSARSAAVVLYDVPYGRLKKLYFCERHPGLLKVMKEGSPSLQNHISPGVGAGNRAVGPHGRCIVPRISAACQDSEK